MNNEILTGTGAIIVYLVFKRPDLMNNVINIRVIQNYTVLNVREYCRPKLNLTTRFAVSYRMYMYVHIHITIFFIDNNFIYR